MFQVAISIPHPEANRAGFSVYLRDDDENAITWDDAGDATDLARHLLGKTLAYVMTGYRVSPQLADRDDIDSQVLVHRVRVFDRERGAMIEDFRL